MPNPSPSLNGSSEYSIPIELLDSAVPNESPVFEESSFEEGSRGFFSGFFGETDDGEVSHQRNLNRRKAKKSKQQKEKRKCTKGQLAQEIFGESIITSVSGIRQVSTKKPAGHKVNTPVRPAIILPEFKEEAAEGEVPRSLVMKYAEKINTLRGVLGEIDSLTAIHLEEDEANESDEDEGYVDYFKSDSKEEDNLLGLDASIGVVTDLTKEASQMRGEAGIEGLGAGLVELIKALNMVGETIDRGQRAFKMFQLERILISYIKGNMDSSKVRSFMNGSSSLLTEKAARSTYKQAIKMKTLSTEMYAKVLENKIPFKRAVSAFGSNAVVSIGQSASTLFTLSLVFQIGTFPALEWMVLLIVLGLILFTCVKAVNLAVKKKVSTDIGKAQASYYVDLEKCKEIDSVHTQKIQENYKKLDEEYREAREALGDSEEFIEVSMEIDQKRKDLDSINWSTFRSSARDKVARYYWGDKLDEVRVRVLATKVFYHERSKPGAMDEGAPFAKEISEVPDLLEVLPGNVFPDFDVDSHMNEGEVEVFMKLFFSYQKLLKVSFDVAVEDCVYSLMLEQKLPRQVLGILNSTGDSSPNIHVVHASRPTVMFLRMMGVPWSFINSLLSQYADPGKAACDLKKIIKQSVVAWDV